VGFGVGGLGLGLRWYRGLGGGGEYGKEEARSSVTSDPVHAAVNHPSISR